VLLLLVRDVDLVDAELTDREGDGDEVRRAQGELPLLPPPPDPAPAPAFDPLKAALTELEPDALSPKAALEALYRLKGLLDTSS